MKILLLASLVVLAAGCGDCAVDCAPGYEVTPGTCSCRPVPDAGLAPGAQLDSATSSTGPCGCAVQTSTVTPGSFKFVQMPLECRCASGACPMTIQDLGLGTACADGGIIQGSKGCGRVSLNSTLMVGSLLIYDSQSGRLVGVYDYSDTAHGPCNVFGYVYGEGSFPVGSALAAAEGSSCATFEACTACGATGDPACF